MSARPNISVTTQTPPAISIITKTTVIKRTDTTAFEAFSLPKGAIVLGTYVGGLVASDAQTTAIISVGSNPGTTDECLSAFDVKGATGQGWYAAGAYNGTKNGVVATSGAAGLSADTLIKAKYTEDGTASTTGGPWFVQVDYYIPPQGMLF